ncbi:hypothetical protein FNW52_02925 [Flavobacterium sp. ZT3R18]|uniref:hypothetical protein n=1 Tax=Flavobacterium sp. ZT3R18 TaxID=2594429 RepID=UPI00117AC329|nr:hypothetical protein [Flavobacterium sp. ZT3R18]TRX37868.1 hypothetical protein FNW52_02925 [Flavobacterium sp. ZT3R18]
MPVPTVQQSIGSYWIGSVQQSIGCQFQRFSSPLVRIALGRFSSRLVASSHIRTGTTGAVAFGLSLSRCLWIELTDKNN